MAGVVSGLDCIRELACSHCGFHRRDQIDRARPTVHPGAPAPLPLCAGARGGRVDVPARVHRLT